MKKLLLLSLLVAISFQGLAQKKQTKSSASKALITDDRWAFKEGTVEFLDYKGRRAMKLTQGALATVKDLNFKDGIIEYDIEPGPTEFANSVYFHRKDEKEQEIVYLRVQKSASKFANDGIQYCPYLEGVNMWDMYPQYQAPANVTMGEWNRIKIVISGVQMQVFVNNKQVLYVPKLEGRQSEGVVAFEGAAYISNVEIKPGVTEGLSSLEGADLTKHEANYIRNWSMTTPEFLPVGTEPTAALTLPRNESFTSKIEAETAGLVSLTRKLGGSPKRRIVWLRSIITTKEAVKTNLQLGFSDEVWIYLNNQLTYVDKNLYTQNMRKYPDGRISVQNASVMLNLKQGANDLMVGVANDFYGWGLIARLQSTENIMEIEAYTPPAKIAIENIDQYLGVYSAQGIPVKLHITQKDGELVVQITDQESQPSVYAGNHVFKVDRYGVEMTFKPSEKKIIFKQNTNVTEFVKE